MQAPGGRPVRVADKATRHFANLGLVGIYHENSAAGTEISGFLLLRSGAVQVRHQFGHSFSGGGIELFR